MKTKELVFAQLSMLAIFYFIAYLTRPWRFVNLVRSLITGNEQTQVDQLLRTKIQRDFRWFKAPAWLSQLMRKVFRESVRDIVQEAK